MLAVHWVVRSDLRMVERRVGLRAARTVAMLVETRVEMKVGRRADQ